MRYTPLILLFLLYGCEEDKCFTFPAKVVEVRILQNGETIVRDDNHPVAGAIIGHAILGGAKGAIIGAMAGSGEKSITHTDMLKACEIYLQTEDGKIHKFLVENPYNGHLPKCALSQVGDQSQLQRWEYTNGVKSPTLWNEEPEEQ